MIRLQTKDMFFLKKIKKLLQHKQEGGQKVRLQ